MKRDKHFLHEFRSLNKACKSQLPNLVSTFNILFKLVLESACFK